MMRRIERLIEGADPLLTLEAMKMETTLSAARSGTVADICVATRDSVEARDLLVVLE